MYPTVDMSGSIPGVNMPLPAAAPAGAAQPAFGVNVSPETLQQYTDALKVIDSCTQDQVRMRLPQARSKVAARQETVTAAQRVLAGLQAQVAKEAKDVEKVTGWYPGKLLKGKDKHQAKLSQEQQELEQAQQQLQGQQGQLTQLQVQLQEAVAEVQALERREYELSAAEGFEASLVESLFHGPAGDAQENALEAAVAGIKPRMEEIAKYKSAYMHADYLLSAAGQKLQQAEQLLAKAQMLATVDAVQDIGRNGGMMGFAVGVQKRNHMQMGGHLLMQAARHIMEAHQVVPSMPYIDVSKAQASSMPGPMMDLAFDNIITDMRARQAISRQLQDARALAHEVRQAQGWVQQWLQGRITQDLAAAESEHRARKGQLDAHRRMLLQQVVAGAR